MMLRIDTHRWFAMAAILNPKWLPNYKNPPDLGKIWFPSRFCSCELIIVMELGAINDPSDHIISCSFCIYSYVKNITIFIPYE
jgi:hypothetical protein